MAVSIIAFLRRWLVCGFVAATVALPILAEQAVERARFEDRLGAFPVEVGLSHNGRSTLDAGIIGELYWDRTGVGGFGASLRSTGPPEGGGTLSSYVSQDFLQANVAFVDDPSEVARVYGAELRSQVVDFLVVSELVTFVGGGLLGTVLLRGPPRITSRRARRWLGLGWGAAAATTSLLLAAMLFARWDENVEPSRTYAMPGIDQLSFSSPQTREIAQQIQPFVEKNSVRIAERTAEYRESALDSFVATLPSHEAALRPREGEKVVLAEADPQGSQVATRLRTQLYPLLIDAVGEESVVVRTVAGDVTSNGTVAEQGFVAREAAASPDVPIVAVKGDHDSDDTVEQLRDEEAEVPDLEIVEAGGLRVAGAADPAFKALFGGMVTNPTGVTETEPARRCARSSTRTTRTVSTDGRAASTPGGRCRPSCSFANEPRRRRAPSRFTTPHERALRWTRWVHDRAGLGGGITRGIGSRVTPREPVQFRMGRAEERIVLAHRRARAVGKSLPCRGLDRDDFTMPKIATSTSPV